MKKFRFLFLVLALILVVGMTTGLIVRKQTGGQTVMQHSGASAPVSTTPATSGGDSEAPEPEATVFKIPVLIREGISKYFTVTENGVEVDPIDVFEYSESSGEVESKSADPDSDPEPYSETYVRYLVDRTCSSITFDHNLRPSDPWFCYTYIGIDFSEPYVFYNNQGEEKSSSGTIDLSEYLSLVIY